MEPEKTVVKATTVEELKSDLIPDEFNELVKIFKELDTDNDDGLNQEEVSRGLDKMGKSAPEAQKIFEELDVNKDGKLTFIEFGQLYKTLKSSRLKAHKRGSLKAGDASALHTLTDEETGAYAEIINYLLKGEEVVKDLIPITPANNLYTNVGNGLILCKLINKAVPGTIDERAINKKKPLNTYQIIENLNLAISSASAIGCMTTGIVPQLIVEKKEYLILAMVWQIVKVWATRQIDLKQHPELIRLLHEGEEINAFLRLPPEEILLRWFNYHLAKAGHHRKVANFSTDVKDGENYIVLLNQLDSGKCSKDALSLDTEKRAVKVIEYAQKIGVPPVFIPAYITSGNAKLNLLFTASIFNICPGLEATEVEKQQAKTLLDDDVGDSREERAFRLWINSFGDEFWVNHLYEDLKDGVKLLKLLDKIQPGCVDWKKVVEKPHNKFQQVGNDNLAVDIGKSLGFSLEGIGGKDILDGNKKLILALVWQMVRKHTMQVLGGIDEAKLLQWANEKVTKDPKITSFKDASMKNSKFLLNLLDAVSPGCVDWAEITDGSNPEEIEKNAKYCISTARKIGVMTYVVWEDIKEVKPKMMLLLVAGICTVDKEKSGKK